MSSMKISLFPLQKRSQYLVFCAVMIGLLLLSFIMATRLGSVELNFDVIKKVLTNKITGRTVYTPTSGQHCSADHRQYKSQGQDSLFNHSFILLSFPLCLVYLGSNISLRLSPSRLNTMT